MKMMNALYVSVFAIFMAFAASPAFATDVTHSTPGISGYDPVSYFSMGKPVKGSGYHVAEYKGVTYAFSSKENKATFESNPEKYVPMYGGYCAYGVAVGKKFVADPEVWKIVDGKLYVNLDKGIQGKWNEDIPGHIKKADKNWTNIQDTSPSAL